MAITEASTTRLHKEPTPPKELNPVTPVKQETFKEVLDRTTLNIGTVDFEDPHIDPQGGTVVPNPGNDLDSVDPGPGFEEGDAINPNEWENSDFTGDQWEVPTEPWTLQNAQNYVGEYLNTSTIPPEFYEGMEGAVPNLAESMAEAMDFTIEEALSADIPWTEHEFPDNPGLHPNVQPENTISLETSQALHANETGDDPASSFASAAYSQIVENDQFVQHFLSGSYGWKPGDMANLIGDVIGTYALVGDQSSIDPGENGVLLEQSVVGLENWAAQLRELMDNYDGTWAPYYWDVGFLPTEQGQDDPLYPVLEYDESSYTHNAENMVDMFMEEDWENIYGPFLTNIGVSLEDWMEEWGQYLIDYTHQPAQDIRETALKEKESLMAQMAPIMEQYRVSTGKTGFQDHYSSNMELENFMQQYQNATNEIDQLAWEQEQQYYDEWMANWTSNTLGIAELGAFDICHYNPDWDICNYELGDDTNFDYWEHFCGDNPEHPLCLDPNSFVEEWNPDEDGNNYDECLDPTNYFIDQFGQCHGPCCQNQGDADYDGDYPEMQASPDQFPNDQRNAFEDIWYSDWWLPDPITGEDSEVLNFMTYGTGGWTNLSEDTWNAAPAGGATGTADNGPEFNECTPCGNVESSVWWAMVNCCPGTFEDCMYNNNCN